MKTYQIAYHDGTVVTFVKGGRDWHGFANGDGQGSRKVSTVSVFAFEDDPVAFCKAWAGNRNAVVIVTDLDTGRQLVE